MFSFLYCSYSHIIPAIRSNGKRTRPKWKWDPNWNNWKWKRKMNL
jgi:hypothetical protein